MKLKTIILSLVIMALITGLFPAAGYADDISPTEQQTVVDKAPENVQAKDIKGYEALTVSWSGVNGASGYTLYMSSTASGGFSKVAYTTGTSYTIHGLATGSRKYFKVETVMPVTGVNAGTSSTNTRVETESEVVSAVPMLDTTNAGSTLKTGTKATVKWTKVSGASGYLVYKKSGSGWKGVKKVKSGKTVSLTQSRLSRKKTHSYLVIPYRNVDGKTVKGYSDTTSIYVPKVLKTSSRTYKYTNQAKIIKKARTKLGSRYVLGAEGPNKFDCSGFTYWVMKKSKVKGVKVKRRSAQGLYNKYKRYRIKRSLSKAQPGDMLFFGYGKSKHRIFHVGIYYGKGKYIHATTGGRGVTISRVPKGSMAAIIRMPGLK